MPIFNVKWLIVAVVFTATVIFLSHLPPEVTPSRLQTGGLDKLAHMLGYGMITLLFLLSLRSSPSLLSASLVLFAIMSGGAMDELTQPFVSRTASVADWLGDIIGMIVALYAFVCFSRLKRRTSVNTGI
jgi:VanZ family protein